MAQRSSSKPLIVIILILLVLVGIGYYFGRGWFASKEAEQAGGFGMPVEMVTVAARPLDVTIDAVGTLTANESVVLRPEMAGRVTEILFTEGQPVKKGAPLFQIDNRMYQANYKQAAAQLKLAELNHARFAKLSKTGASTKQRFDEASANLGVAQANLDYARAQLDYTRITAPFDGFVGLRKISPGDYVNVGQELANYVSYDPMKVNFSIPETQANLLKVDQQIDISVEALPGETFRGNVYALDPQLDVAGRAVSLRATIPNEDGKLKPGYFARISLTVEHKDAAIVIPEAAIVPQGDTKLVYKVATDDTVSFVPVTLGKRLNGEVEITEGVVEGDRLVTSGQIKLQPGAKVADIAAMQPPAKEEAPTAAAEPAPEPAAEAPAEEAVPAPAEVPAAEPAPIEAPEEATGNEGAAE